MKFKEYLTEGKKKYLLVYVDKKDEKKYLKLTGDFYYDDTSTEGNKIVYKYEEENPDALEKSIEKIVAKNNISVRYELED